MNMPAIAALIKLAKVAASIAFMPNLAISGRLLGAIEPIPPSKIAMDDKLAKPHKAKVTMACVVGVRVSLISIKFE